MSIEWASDVAEAFGSYIAECGKCAAECVTYFFFHSPFLVSSPFTIAREPEEVVIMSIGHCGLTGVGLPPNVAVARGREPDRCSAWRRSVGSKECRAARWRDG